MTNNVPPAPIKQPAIVTVAPLPPRSGWEGSGVGGGAAYTEAAFLRIDPPPPTPPHHAQERVEGGEITTHEFTISRHDCPRFAFNFPPSRSEGAGNAGRPMRPIAACAMIVRDAHALVRSHRFHPAFPAQWF